MKSYFIEKPGAVKLPVFQYNDRKLIHESCNLCGQKQRSAL
jgi:hypothetical protein